MKIDDKYKWLARDEDGELWAYTEKPSKIGDVIWDVTEDVEYYSAVIYEEDETYSFIKWESENPTTIGDVEEQLKFNEYLSNQKEIGEAKDNVNKPNHYIGIHGLEVEEVLQNFIPRYENSYAGHRVASAIEYLLRAPLKNKLEDIEKAKQNLEQILNYEKEQPHE